MEPYNVNLTKALLWLIGISFLTKFPVVMLPLNEDFETVLYEISFFSNLQGRAKLICSCISRTIMAGLVCLMTIVCPNCISHLTAQLTP